MPILVGNGKNSVEFSIITDWGFPLESKYPSVVIRYTSKPSQINYFKHLSVKISVDGQETKPDNEEYIATYIRETPNTVTFEEKDCCANLAERLNVNISADEIQYSEAYHHVQIVVRKDFKSLKKLPEKMTVILTATSDKGTTEMERTMFLTTQKGSSFFRFH